VSAAEVKTTQRLTVVEATVDSLPLKVREEQRAAEHALEERLKVQLAVVHRSLADDAQLMTQRESEARIALAHTQTAAWQAAVAALTDAIGHTATKTVTDAESVARRVTADVEQHDQRLARLERQVRTEVFESIDCESVAEAHLP
jgi:hypothetical protein